MIKTFTCQRCGQEFDREWYPSRSIPKYCSPECRMDRVKIICPICEQPFHVPRCRAVVRVHCSHECNLESLRRQRITTCEQCGKVFEARDPSQKKRRRYCSHGCAMQALKDTRRYVICAECGKRFWVKKGYESATYCSLKCANTARGREQRGPDNPNWKGGTIKDRGPNWHAQAMKARKRDGYKCQRCGITMRRPALPVHHIIPYRDFDGDYLAANDLSNLVTLCPQCHAAVENGDRPRNESGQFRERPAT